MKIYDTIIIGAGIAGCTAAIYAARKRMNFLLISEYFGGQFNESGEVLNYPGIKQTTGGEFAEIISEQLKFNGVKVSEGIVVEKISKNKDNFVLHTNKGKLNTKTVIIATGSHPRRLDVPGEKEFQKLGLTYCAICDGPLYKNKEVAVIGGGDSALEAVDFLLNIAKKIYVININAEFKAHEYLQEKIKKNKKVKVINKAKTVKIVGDKFVRELVYERDGKQQKLKVDGVFVEVGRIPNTEFVKDFLKLDEHRHILVDAQMNTSVAGIFAVGDCSSVHEYQYVIAAGTGCIALLKAARYLAQQK